MIEQGERAESSEQVVAQKVAEYLKDCHPGGVTIEVDPADVHREGSGWRVRVRPSAEPSDRFEYYEALADVAVELQEREHLNVFLVPSDPKHLPAAENNSRNSRRNPPSSPAFNRAKRRRGMTSQAVGEKVAEYLRDCHPGGISLEIEPGGIRETDHGWEVPVRPDREPWKLSEYYAALAAVEAALEEREQLQVFLVPSPSEVDPIP